MIPEEPGRAGRWLLSSPHLLSFKVPSIVKCTIDVIVAFQGEKPHSLLIMHVKF